MFRNNLHIQINYLLCKVILKKKYGFLCCYYYFSVFTRFATIKLFLVQSQASKLEAQFFVSAREISKFLDIIIFFFELGF
jgi:hypothetical protein